MNEDLDTKLYNEFLNGNKEAFGKLYMKYKAKIHYFISNIIKDSAKAEEITQDTFLYIFKSNIELKYSFKNYVYLVAKSRAISYISIEKRRSEIDNKYLLDICNEEGDDILDNISKNECKKEIFDIIGKLDDKYKNAIYLTKIEGLSYTEVANILEENVANVKNLVHRGKKQMRKLIINERWYNMNKSLKVIIIFVLIAAVLSTATYGVIKIYKKSSGAAKLTPTSISKITQEDGNKVWCGTFNLVWNDFMDELIGGKVEFADGKGSILADELNTQPFKINDISEDSYVKIHGPKTEELKEKIENEIKRKFNETSDILDEIEWNDPTDYVLYAMLKKEFNFLEKFSNLSNATFKNSNSKFKYFGIDLASEMQGSENVDVLFYNSDKDFAVKLKTKEKEEVYLYRNDGNGKSFTENYEEMLKKSENYTGSRNFENGDELRVPYIKIDEIIRYNELCSRKIKNSSWFIEEAIQTVKFELNNVGGSVKSEALISAGRGGIGLITPKKNRSFNFDDTFLIFLKEETKEKPYLGVRVYDPNVLMEAEIN